MSTFYSVLSNYYDQFYPTTPVQVEMISEFMGQPPKKLLYIGCATGALAKQLYDRDYSVICLDKEPRMLEKVRERESNIETVESDMREVFKLSGGYSGVLALGDILTHVESVEELEELLSDLASKLVPYGGIVIELNNYDSILSSKHKKLPDVVLRTRTMGLKRTFETDEHRNLIKRNVIRIDDLLIESKQQVYPIKSSEIQNLLRDAGFTDIEIYGNFAGEQFNPKRSHKMIITARKQ